MSRANKRKIDETSYVEIATEDEKKVVNKLDFLLKSVYVKDQDLWESLQRKVDHNELVELYQSLMDIKKSAKLMARLPEGMKILLEMLLKNVPELQGPYEENIELMKKQKIDDQSPSNSIVVPEKNNIVIKYGQLSNKNPWFDVSNITLDPILIVKIKKNDKLISLFEMKSVLCKLLTENDGAFQPGVSVDTGAFCVKIHQSLLHFFFRLV